MPIQHPRVPRPPPAASLPGGSELYERRTGRSLSAINYYRAFSHWRLAAIGQGVYKRYLVGAMGTQDGINLDNHRESVRTRARAALALLV